MDEVKEKMDFNASDVEACRICLATDVKMHSLRDTHLATCMQSVAGFDESCEGLPNYICYVCASSLLKCNELIKKSKSAQATLEDIFAKKGQITKTLIKEQNRTELKLQSTLDSYLLLNYFYIKYDDDNNTSDFINTESDPNEKINIKVKNETKDDTSEEASDSEILKILTESIDFVTKGSEGSKINEESNSDSEVEAIEQDIPVVEIVSDGETIGDDFISLKSYDVRIDTRPRGYSRNLDVVPIYDVPILPSIRGIEKKRKKKKKTKPRKIVENTPNPVENYVQKYFHIIKMPQKNTKKYSCKHCSQKFNYVEDAKDHTFLGCSKPQGSSNHTLSLPISLPGANTSCPDQPTIWKTN